MPTVKPISKSEIRQLQVHTQHANKDDLIRYLKRLEKWHPSLTDVIENFLRDCACRDADERRAKAVAVINEKRKAVLSYVIIDILYLDGVPCLHIMERATTFSVIAMPPLRHMNVQIRTFNAIWRAAFGTPVTTQADKEYDANEFIEFWDTFGIDLMIVQPKAHDTQ